LQYISNEEKGDGFTIGEMDDTITWYIAVRGR
jgi:hypothetical protein